MDRSRVIAGYRVAFAVLTLAAIVYQAWYLLDAGRLDLGNFLSYFTIQSNLLAAAVFLLGAARARAGTLPSRTWDLVRGGAVVYMTVTFVVVILLLSGVEVDTQVVWVDIVVHKLFPIVVFADWLIDPPRHRLTVRDSLVWLVFPLVWLAYTMIRGAIVSWYPYPFLDPANGGYGTVVVYVVGILVFGVVLCAAISALGTMLGGRRSDVVSPGPVVAPPA